MSDDSEELEFVDPEQGISFNKEGVGLREIVFLHLQKIGQICTKEFKEGYWQKKPVATSSGVYISEIYHEDQRDAYINAVDYLYDILLPKFDTDAKTNLNKIENDLEKKRQSFKAEEKNAWIDEKLLYKRKVLQELSLLLSRLNYMQMKRLDE